jgi:hypothetical protein
MGLEQRGRVKWSHGRSNWKQEDHGGPEADSQRSKNVVKVATNPRKFRRQSEQNGENRVARFCRNLLLFSVLRRLRQDLVNLIHCFASRGPRVRVPPRLPTIFSFQRSSIDVFSAYHLLLEQGVKGSNPLTNSRSLNH